MDFTHSLEVYAKYKRRNSMKKNYLIPLQIITCILLVISIFRGCALENELQNVQNNLSNRISEVRSDVNNISYEISSTMEKEASLLAMAEWSYGAFDEEAKIVEIICKISPKEYTSETTAAVVYAGQEYPLTLDNGTFTGAVDIPVFEEAHLELVCFKDGENVRSESLDWYITPRSEYLLDVYAQFSGGQSYRRGEDVLIISYKGDIQVEVINKEDWDDIKKIELVEYMDDKEIARTNISYDDASTASWCEWRKDVEIPFGSTYKVYVETVDNYGLHYHNLVLLEEIDSYGEPADDWEWWHGAEADIYNAEGNPLYVKEYEEY